MRLALVTRLTLSTALLLVGCGRLGYDLLEQPSPQGGAGSGGTQSTNDAASGGVSLAGAGGSSSGGANAFDASAGGAAAAGTGGTGAASGGASGGNAGADGGSSGGTAGATGASDGGSTGGTGSSSGGAAASGGAGGTSTGADGGPCVPTNGGVEICDGRDNDCNGSIDEAGCPTRCSGLAHGGRGYMYCINANLYWDACRSTCQAAGMDLVVVDDLDENQFIANWLSTKHTAAWLGGTDQVTEGTWLWVDGRQFWSGTASGNAVNGAFTSWYPGQPDNGGTSGPDSDCLMMTWSVPGAWYDARCQDFHDYICEAP